MTSQKKGKSNNSFYQFVVILFLTLVLISIVSALETTVAGQPPATPANPSTPSTPAGNGIQVTVAGSTNTGSTAGSFFSGLWNKTTSYYNKTSRYLFGTPWEDLTTGQKIESELWGTTGIFTNETKQGVVGEWTDKVLIAVGWKKTSYDLYIKDLVRALLVGIIVWLISFVYVGFEWIGSKTEPMRWIKTTSGSLQQTNSKRQAMLEQREKFGTVHYWADKGWIKTTMILAATIWLILQLPFIRIFLLWPMSFINGWIPQAIGTALWILAIPTFREWRKRVREEKEKERARAMANQIAGSIGFFKAVWDSVTGKKP
jgi:hypothetical protein